MTGLRPSASDRGSVTVEFAVGLPVVALVLVSLVAGVVLVDRAGRLGSVAGTAARALGRDDERTAAAALATVPGSTSRVRHEDGLVCVDVQGTPAGPFAVLPLRATGCAAGGGG
ncbi:MULTISPECIES: hypothetical protein [unclassified Curtobacterium]|uniref:hypothetical protein n=1 Tax=unclassified Curtobacterium TaxID=257496 RepID=UPI00052A4903|nr:MULTISPECIES: hypothetical protein [unclassified Curtobacterium]AIV40505.1 hypothetical protein NI26_10715 [Curtobacterium sp. MR_MD2014]MBP1302343.1 hypothetical protein [Curtobacterium sp. 1310]MCM3504478.1 hypothetical protein [Curtobacterium sp. ODYSSEY 48 V2]MDB6425679.1 hypothetical protein [Curtobacterium sp. 20TX0008]MDT0211913.1 hypothetical protein [Curtobacterium sp. BRD11]